MAKFRVEFNTTGFYSGQGIWEVLDETAEIEAETAQEAIELAIDWMAENDLAFVEDDDSVRTAYEEYAWRAAEISLDEYGQVDDYNWEFRD